MKQYPKEKAYDKERRTVRLEYEGDTPPCGEYNILGGVAWPQWSRDTSQPAPSGVLVICGRRIVANRPAELYVLHEASFLTIDPVYDFDNHVVLSSGAAADLNRAWSEYFCRAFYVHDSGDDNNHKWMLQVYRCDSMVEPRPSFVQVPYGDPRIAEQTLMARLQAGWIRYPKGTMVDRELTSRVLDKTHDLGPALRALAAAVQGDEAHMWRPY
jgi:hypothetical protein